MTRFVTMDNPYLLLGWAAARLGMDRIWPPESVQLAVVDDGNTIHAVVIFNAFYDDACHVHIATNGKRAWATRATLRQLFGYPFQKLGLNRISARVKASNVPAQITLLKLGFSFEGVARSALDGEDAISFGLLKTDCKFIPQLTEQDASSQHMHEAQDGKVIGSVA